MNDLERLAAAATAERWEDVDRISAVLDAEAEAKEHALRQPGALGRSALWYAATLGIPVFPIRAGDKRPATVHGFQDATRDPALIREWWTKWPDANIGWPTGYRFDVIDIDGPEGVDYYSRVREAGKAPEIIAVATTPRGFHYYIAPTGAGNTTNLLPSVDYRGDGGYVLAPPSFYNGAPATDRQPAKPAGPYRWIQPLTPEGLTNNGRTTSV